MRYHYQKPDIYLSMYGELYICNHPVYDRSKIYGGMCVNRLINSYPTHKLKKRAAVSRCCSTLEDVT